MWPDTVVASRNAAVHHATGLVVGQLGVGSNEALAALRANAYIPPPPEM